MGGWVGQTMGNAQYFMVLLRESLFSGSGILGRSALYVAAWQKGGKLAAPRGPGAPDGRRLRVEQQDGGEGSEKQRHQDPQE